MQDLLKGQKALVTGASSGIGAATARALAEAGADVLVNYHSDQDGAEATAAAIREQGRQALVFKANVADEDQVGAMFQAMFDTFGRIDILVSNAGMQKDVAFARMSLKDWSLVLDVNLTGAFLCAREATRAFLRQGIDPSVSRAAGKLIFMSSVHETIPWAGRVNYAASKGGMNMLMESIAQEVAHHRIRVNSIAPGAIKTDINRQAWEEEGAQRELLKLIPYGRVGEPEDVARVVAWLVSDQADYMTGATVPVDGGMLLYPGFREGG
ncbi:MAG: 3-oxoacyl-ACP reductase FabG [Candidatus Competibacteraceae bacterium]|nr:3-oxoacyl-ACP reductase FabG [Candidatus Competibacteraceae bacterium]